MCAKMIILISFEIANYNGIYKAKDKMKSNLSIFSHIFFLLNFTGRKLPFFISSQYAKLWSKLSKLNYCLT